MKKKKKMGDPLNFKYSVLLIRYEDLLPFGITQKRLFISERSTKNSGIVTFH
ncbi:Vinculin [Bienertia sinuspersici]